MRALVQRVTQAAVRVGDEVTGEIGPGFLVLLGVRQGDTEAEAQWLVDKLVKLRLFAGEDGRFDLDLRQAGGSVLVVSQFTLYGDCKKGRRPDFTASAHPSVAEPLYEAFVAKLRALGLTVATGRFGAMMAVSLVNDGPVTLMLEREAA